MLKKALIFFMFSILILADTLEIDANQLEKEILKNPNDILNRLILAKYYENHKNYKKALIFINQILEKDPKNKKALLLKKEILSFQNTQKLNEKYGNLDKYINNLYEKEKYKEILSFYTKYKPLLKPKTLIKIARIAMWEGDYDLSLKILNSFKENNLDVLEIKAYDYFFKGDYIKANRLFKILYNATGQKDYGIKLIETYIRLGDALSAKKVLYSLKYKLSKQEYQKYFNLIEKKLFSYINILKKQYTKNPTYKNLKKFIIALYDLQPDEAIEIVKNYLKNNPENFKAKILLAKLYIWKGETQKATKILDTFTDTDNYQAKLLYGKILAWNGMYKKAKIFLMDVYQNGNTKQKYEALKMLGFIEMWQNHKENAKKIFEKLYKINPKDEEVKEALMILKGKIKPLIIKYEKLLKKYPNNMDYVLKLADLYYMLPNYEKAAKYYEIYLQHNPDKIEIYKTLGDIYLELKKYYKGFSDWEYYAAIKNTPDAYLELAKRYYWNGFMKESLDILNKLINKYPNYKQAIELKAKILKINPRYLNYNYETAIEKYFNNRAQKLLIYGDRSYFAGFYKTAQNYYKDYLFINPDDANVREKYAYTLEFTGNYSTAAGEFYNLFWYKKNPIIEYHYAYCLQKSGKLKEAKKIYEKLLNEVPKPLPEKLKKFIYNWKKAWESMNFEKYASFYDNKIKNNIYWRLKKQNIFKKAGFISVGIYNPILLQKKRNIYKIKFYQVYASQIKKDKGYKTLWIKCNKDKCLIIKEKWSPGKFRPDNPENSLLLLIRENLQEIDTPKTIIKNNENITYENIPSKKQNKNNIQDENNLTQPNDFMPLNKILKKKETKITLAEKNITRETNTSLIKENLNIEKFKIVKVTKKNAITKEIKKRPPNYFLISLYHFHDNQKTHYNHIEAKYLKNFGSFDAGIFVRFFEIKQDFKKDSGNITAGIIRYRGYEITAGIDNAKKSDLYLNIKSEYKHHNINILYENLVYSRKTICSLINKRLKLEASRYKQLNNIRGLWYSIAGEYIDDGNLVFTPQIDYDFYNNKIFNSPYAFFFSGWYQFNSKQTNCYYSPDKTDSNLVGIKFYPKNKFADIMFKGGIGYSIWDKAFLYKLGFNVTKNIKLFNINAKCEYANTSPVNAPNNYKSYECYLNMGKTW